MTSEAERSGPPQAAPTSPTNAMVAEWTDRPYQLLPPLSDDEYAALREDIATSGVRVPVDVDEDGQVLDGHHRRQIAAELGVECPVRVVPGLTEEEKRHHAVAVNAHRRMLTRDQRRGLVATELDRDPSRSDRLIGRICGVDGKTVAAMRVRRGEVRNSALSDGPPNVVGEAEARMRTVRIRDGLASIDDIATQLVVGGRALEAVRFLTTGMDDLLAWRPDDAEWRAGVRVIFEPRIRAALMHESLATGDPAPARAADVFVPEQRGAVR
jgi:hypothetical protein